MVDAFLVSKKWNGVKMVQKVRELSAEEFGAFEEKCPYGSFYQSVEQGNLMLKEGHKATYMGLVDGDKIIVAGLLVGMKIHFGYRFDIYGGPLFMPGSETKANLSAFVEAVEEYVRNQNGMFLRLIPNLPVKTYNDAGELTASHFETLPALFKELGYDYQDYHAAGYDEATHVTHYEYKKDVRDMTEQTLEKSFDKKTRYNIKKAKEFGVKLRDISFDELPEFKKDTAMTAERLHFPDKSLDYYQNVYREFGDKIRFVVAEIDSNEYIDSYQQKIKSTDDKIAALKAKNKGYEQNKIDDLERQKANHQKKIDVAKDLQKRYPAKFNVAGAMFVIQPQEIDYVFSYTNEEFKTFKGPFMLQDAMMKAAVDQKIPTYNFLGVAGLFDGSDGVFEFKQGFNGYTDEMIGEFSKVLIPWRYKLLNAIKTVLGRSKRF
ncbi:Peptidoglycan interpeptide bridge formation enzyme [Furfurilactobacillus rossiae]|jgi:alanine adding enzyme|nr:Peptidoglycan interpeptide bridge formation enzyme [Furfurilactobacillus rossiae]QLE69979.1 Peptidoglycan interpeptide bridge formation enzyme [Furfurilactobacillus rossiae]